MLNLFALEQHIVSQMTAYKVPGLALALVEVNKVVYAKGLGVTSVGDGGVPVTPQTLFRIGSITKPMTGTLIMRLVEERRLELDALAKDYIPNLRFSQPEAADLITIRMLMSHTAGLPTSHEAFGRRDPTGLHDYIEGRLPQYKFIASPGKLYSYSNPGIRLLGYIAEVVCGKPYTQLMQEYIFDPLEMHHTTFDPTVAMTYALAHSHDLNDDGTLSVQPRFGDNTAGYPSGSIISTVLDLAHFAMMLLHGGRFHNRQIISAESVRQMQTLHGDKFTVTGDGYGLTLSLENVQGVARVGHQGAVGTYGAKLIMLPDSQRAVMMICNRSFGFWGQMAEIPNRIIAEWLELPTESPSIPIISPDTAYWQGYLGEYVGQLAGLVKIYLENQQLALEWNGEKIPLSAFRQDLYFNEQRGISIGFIPEDDGSVEYIMFNGSPCQRIEQRISGYAPDECFVGIYMGIDKLKVRLQEGHLYVYSAEENAEFKCIPLSETAFASNMGTFEFAVADDGHITGLRLQMAYHLKRQG